MASASLHSSASKNHLGLDLVLCFMRHCGLPWCLYYLSLLCVHLPFTVCVWAKGSKSAQTGLMRMLLILKIKVRAVKEESNFEHSA